MSEKKVVELAPIESGVVYPLSEFMKKTGLGKQALTVARSQGLKTAIVANRVYVRGDDFLEFCEQRAAAGFRQ